MEEQKRMEYGFQGYRPPPLPRARRSARGRAGGWHEKKNYVDNGGVCFELLATVAGQLLQEKETEKTSSELEGISTTGMRQKVQDIWQGEEENSPEQALLDLHNSQHASHSIGASEVTVGNATQQLGFKDSQYKGSSHENIMSSSVVHRKLSFQDPAVSEDAGISQSIFRTTSILGKSGIADQSPDRKRDLELLCDSQLPNEGSMVVLPEEGERSTRSNEKEKECICTDAYGEGNLLRGQSLLDASQDSDSKGKLKGSMGPLEDHEGKGENDVNEINSVHWQRKETTYVRTEDAALLDVHPLLVSLTRNAEVSTVVGLNSHELGSSGSNEKGPLCIENKPCDSSIDDPKDMINLFRDDDDNSSDITNPSTVPNKSRQALPAKGTKFGRSISSKYRRIASTRKRNYSKMVVNTDGIVHTESPGSGLRWKRQRTVRYPPLKRKMLAAGFSPSDINANTSCTLLDVNALDIEQYDSPTKPCSAKSGSIPSLGSAPVSSSQKSVKLGIKSFAVPELFIEVPESATVANLKKAATEAVINLLEGGFQIRVLLQGMKVTDENASLIQEGTTSHPEKLETVGFMLEPNSIPSSSTGADDPLFMLSHAASRTSSTHPKASCSGSSIDIEVNKGLIDGSCSETNVMFTADVAQMAGCQTQDINQWAMSESDLIIGSSHPQAVSYSGALVVHPSVVEDSKQGLTLVPMRHRSRRADIGKRRLRRPFTVAEVEVLVQAVEKLGTGRWREIKLHAFDHAKHRTYVDLKDKWKTLVHTATISPHQRRGEPVPLELLDRVIRAHSYWTKRQTNQMLNHSL